MDLQQEQAYWKFELEVVDSDSSWVTKFDTSKKKKKKMMKLLIREDATYDILFQKDDTLPEFYNKLLFMFDITEDNAQHCQSGRRLLPGHNFDPEYGYEEIFLAELLSRVFDMLREDDLEVSTERPRAVMIPPRLLAQGTQLTVCLNFAHLCRTMHRKSGHVITFLLGQLETKGLLNKQQPLDMKGLVFCCCKSPDTALAEGLLTLRCEMCGLVASIKEPNPL